MVFPSLRTELFKDNDRDGYMELKVSKDNIRETIYHHSEFTGFAERVKRAFDEWKADNWTRFNEINSGEHPKQFIEDISKSLLDIYDNMSLIDKYDVYQCLMSFWEETMQDDVYAIVFDGWESGRDIEREMVKKKDGTTTGKMKSFEGRVIPKALIIEMYFQKEKDEIAQLEIERDQIVSRMEEMKEEHCVEEGLLAEVVNDKGNITKGELRKRIKEIRHDKDAVEEFKVLQQYEELMTKESKLNSNIKNAVSALDKLVYNQYGKLSTEEIKDIVVEKKWCQTIYEGIENIYSAISHSLTNRIIELVERYEEPLPQIRQEVADYEAKVKSHLERMGFAWK
jgi:type I restriction enzyme M protein